MSAAGDYIQHWDDKFSTRAWGRYPPEDLVRFMGRQFAGKDRSSVSVLEVGCGPGANLWFLHREAYQVSGIDGSLSAIRIAEERLATENKGLNKHVPDLRVGNFSTLPWADSQFDVVLDIFAIYANTLPVIDQVVSEVHRVLRPGGLFYSKVWGRNCTGYGQGREIEPGTYDDIPAGPCQDMGVSHFFDRAEIDRVFSRFSVRAVDVLTRTDSVKNLMTEEYLCQFERRS